MNHNRMLFRAAMVIDGAGVSAAPGAVLVEGRRIIAAGAPQAVGEPSNCRVVDMPNDVLIPGLVNVHCHLDLTHIGPQPFTGDFVSWVTELRRKRAASPEAIDSSVRLGVEKSRAGGTAIIGDIAGVSSLQPVQTLRSMGLPGVSFFEVFGLAGHQRLAMERIRMALESCPLRQDGVTLGLEPHAPYSCGLEVFWAAAEADMPRSTHLAETHEEIEFVRTAGGPLAQMLKQIGVWDDAITGHQQHPIDLLLPILRAAPFLAAHVNYLDDGHLELLATTPTSIAYCPRAHAYFGHDRKQPHRYREMIDLGINVALGTDSIIGLDTPDRISVLDDMRRLWRRDAANPKTLLRMATINGAKALEFDERFVTLAPGETLGVLAVPLGEERTSRDPFECALSNDLPPRWALGPFSIHD